LRRTEKDYLREKEEEEEALERKKAEKKAREKEVAYQVKDFTLNLAVVQVVLWGLFCTYRSRPSVTRVYCQKKNNNKTGAGNTLIITLIVSIGVD
jgi:hypothetical protein